MLYKVIKEILNESKEQGKDIGVATDMLISKGADTNIYNNALNVLRKNYNAITTFNREGKEELIVELCNLVESADNEGLAVFLEKHDKFIKMSIAKAKTAN